MGACGACFVSKRAPRRPSHACTLSRVEILPSQGLVPLEVQRGMGACGARFVSKRASRRPSHACTLSRVEILPSQGLVPLEVQRGMGACGARFVSKRAPRRPSHACTLTRVEIFPSQELVPLEGSPYLVRNRAIKRSAAEAVISRRGRAFLGVAAARARSGRRGQADVTACHVPCYSSP
jgi:hypothetical protein